MVKPDLGQQVTWKKMETSISNPLSVLEEWLPTSLLLPPFYVNMYESTALLYLRRKEKQGGRG